MKQIVTRLFDTFADAEHAVIELERVGVPHDDISLVSNSTNNHHVPAHVRAERDHTAGEASARDASVGAATGGAIGAVGGALAGLGLLAIPGLGPVVAAGWLASAAVGALVGGAAIGAAGGLVGALTHSGVSEDEAHIYAEAVRRGATLVSAKVDDDHVLEAETVLSPLPSVDVTARGSAYRQAGWRGFDDTAAPYTEDEVAAERARYLS